MISTTEMSRGVLVNEVGRVDVEALGLGGTAREGEGGMV